MESSVFDFSSYRSYLLSALGDKGRRSGIKSKAARFIGCHTTQISQVLHGSVDLSLEQAEKLSRFLNHNDEETHYFLLLLQKERAGTRGLQSHFQKQLDEMKGAKKLIKARLGKTDSVSEDHEQKYYGSWIYGAAHVGLSVHDLRTAESLAARLQVPVLKMREILEFLASAGLAKMNAGQFNIGPKHVHLAGTSPSAANHHRNWRVKALQSLDAAAPQDFHYSAAVTLSHEDISVVREQLLKTVKDLSRTIESSKEEEIYALNLDFFRV